MRLEPMIAILGMALVMVVMRLGGYWLAGRMTPSPRTAAVLGQVGAVTLVALIAPALANAGPPGWVGAVVALVVGKVSGSLFAALAVGVAAVALLRMTSLG